MEGRKRKKLSSGGVKKIMEGDETDMETLIDTLCIVRQNLETKKEAVTSIRDKFDQYGETKVEWHTQHGQMLGFKEAVDVVDGFIEEAERRLER